MATPLPFRPTHAQRLTHPQLPGIVVEFMFITAAIAQQMLAANAHNRPLRDRAIAAYARDMATGSFPFNGDAIRRTADGLLLDGQHRLAAVIESGIGQLMLVITGLAIETQNTMDTGLIRMFSDQLKLAGEEHNNMLAAASRKVLFWEMGLHTFESNIRLTQAELADCLDRYPELRASASFASRNRVTGLGPSLLCMSHWLLSRIDQESAEWFLGRVHDGVGLPAGHPALLLPKRVRDNQTRRIRLSDGENLALIITAWNAFRDGRVGQNHLKLPGNLSSANFPVPR